MGERLYVSPRIYDFQADGVARAYLGGNKLATWSTGIGKTHLAMALSALLFEDELVDVVLLACESNKLIEWLGDFRRFTKLDPTLYRGSPERRGRILNEGHQVLIGTYETIRNDAAVTKSGTRSLDPGPLLTALKGQRVLVVYDEVAKLKGRTSQTYRAHEYLLRELRKAAETRTLGLTATPIERSPENILNIARLIQPGICTIAQFEEDHVRYNDQFGNYAAFKNLGPDDNYEPWVTPLSEKLAPILLVKDKSDPDVRDEFPNQVEDFAYVDLDKRSREFYTAVSELDLIERFDLEEESQKAKMMERALGMVLRQIAAHPQALLHSSGQIARLIVDEVGEAGIKALPQPKVEALLRTLDQLVNEEGLQVLVFTTFGQSVLPLLRDAINEAKISVAINHGGLTLAEQEEQKDAFKTGRAAVYLSSDAGSKGVNLPEATWTINYELPVLHSTYEQRIARNHRIDSDKDQVFVRSLIVRDSIEEGIARKMMTRNQWWDSFIESHLAGGDREYRPTARERKLLMRIAENKTQEDL